MLLDHFEHRGDVVLRDRLRHAAARARRDNRGTAPSRRHARALLIGFAGHDRGDRAAERAAFLAVVAVAVAHDERAEVRVAEAEGAEDVRVLRDLLDRVTGVIDDDFLRGDEDADGGLEALDVERAVVAS